MSGRQGWRGGYPGVGRAPRLDPGTTIARYLSRRGRFARIDPLRPHPLPSAAKVAGALGWALLLAGTLYRAWRTAGPRTAPDA